MEDILVHDYQDTFFEKKETENEPTLDSPEPITEAEIIEEKGEELSIEIESVSESTPEVEIEIAGYSKSCSMAVDFFVIILFLFKFALS